LYWREVMAAAPGGLFRNVKRFDDRSFPKLVCWLTCTIGLCLYFHFRWSFVFKICCVLLAPSISREASPFVSRSCFSC